MLNYYTLQIIIAYKPQYFKILDDYVYFLYTC